MREIIRWTEPRGREGGANRRRVLLIYRDHREGCIYALRLLRRSIEGGRKVFYLSLSERTEGLMEILRDSMGWVGGEPLKIIGSEEARDYLGTLLGAEMGWAPEDAQIYLDLGLDPLPKESLILRLCDENIREALPPGVTLILGCGLKLMSEIDMNTFIEIMDAHDSILFSFGEGRKAFSEAVEFVVCRVLGRVPCDTIFKILEQRYNLRKEAIAEEFCMFKGFLRGLFGYGGTIIKRLILEELYKWAVEKGKEG